MRQLLRTFGEQSAGTASIYAAHSAGATSQFDGKYFGEHRDESVLDTIFSTNLLQTVTDAHVPREKGALSDESLEKRAQRDGEPRQFPSSIMASQRCQDEQAVSAGAEEMDERFHEGSM